MNQRVTTRHMTPAEQKIMKRALEASTTPVPDPRDERIAKLEAALRYISNASGDRQTRECARKALEPSE